jgi:hypothetical protein
VRIERLRYVKSAKFLVFLEMPAAQNHALSISASDVLSVGLAASILVVSGCGNSDGRIDKYATPAVDAQPAKSTVMLADITREAGLTFENSAVDAGGPYFMPRQVGSGAALLDFDDDGDLDIYLIQNAGPDPSRTNRLFRQDADGKYSDVTVGSGLDVAGYGMGVAAGDVNNDGHVDVLVSEYGAVRMFLNQGVGASPQFVDITQQAGLDNPMWGTSTCFVDYDRDGWLDLVLVNYVNYDPSRWCADGSGRQEFCGPDAFPGRVSKLFHNLGPADKEGAETGGLVRFADVTIESGLAAHPGPGLGVFCADFDGDRWPDIFVANDGKPNHLFINQRDGTFKEEAATRGIAYNLMGKSEADMGVAMGDVDGDGNFDIFVTHLSVETHTLWLQGPRGMFQDRTATTGLATMAWRATGFGTVMADFDNDGALDIAIANGRVTRASNPNTTAVADLDDFWIPYAERDQLLMNDGQGRFDDVSQANAAFSSQATVSRGLACGDIDGDGGVDLLVTRIAGPAGLYRNVAPGRGHWLMVRAIDPALRRDAYGAEVHVSSGQRRWMRWINPGYSYLCSNDPRAHFGLGTASQVDTIEVVWPDGTMESYPGGAVDRLVVLRRGDGQAVAE